MNWRGNINVTLLLMIVALCLFEFILHRQSSIFCNFEAALLSLQWMLLLCLVIWCGAFHFVTFSSNDLPLVGLLLIAIAAYFIGYAESSRAADAVILLAGVTMGRGTRFLLKNGNSLEVRDISKLQTPNFEFRIFLVGLVGLLAFSAWWHLEVARNIYPGTRWTGLWDNPNIYGMLMSVGVLLAVGLLANGRWKLEDGEKRKVESGKWKLLSVFLLIAAGMMGVGLFFSYSRGAWLGTVIGLLYLAKAHGKFKWRFVLLIIFVVSMVVWFFWNATPDNAPWYVKRMDFGRPSAQHRVSAWRGALQMMRDHPFGVGWNNAVETYDKNYSPPENGAAALTMNSYLMLGTELGIPALVCFVAYIALRLGVGKKPHLTLSLSPSVGSGEGMAREDTRPTTLDMGHGTLDATQVACRAGALTLAVAFWFDGGLFDLPTASVFWILLELGSVSNAEGRMKNEETEQSSQVVATPRP
jgi:hypothetical protein